MVCKIILPWLGFYFCSLEPYKMSSVMKNSSGLDGLASSSEDNELFCLKIEHSLTSLVEE
jgi:hypothetical protein